MGLDICLYKQHDQIEELKLKMEKFVQERVMAFDTHQKHLIMQKQAKIENLEELLNQRNQRIG